MKKLILITAIFSLCIIQSYAQYWYYGSYTNTYPPGIGTLGTAGGYDVIFGTNSTQQMDLKYPSGAFGIGNSYSPSYQLDVRCDPTLTHPSLSDINVSCPNCSPANSVGYRIGGNRVLWHNGDISSIFVGVGAGNAGDAGSQNTFIGGNAGSGVTTVNGNANVAVGYYSLTAITGGNHNTALGDHALYSNTTQNFNTAVGGNALQNNNAGSNNTATGANALISNTGGHDNVAMGYEALYLNSTNSFNTAIGEGSLYNNTEDYSTAFGYYSLYNNTTGQYNTAAGTWALNNNQTGNNNTAVGLNALLNIKTGSDNTALGFNAGKSATLADAGNLFLGSGADRNTGAVQNAAAIGYGAITTANNQFEIGNNNVTTTLGMSTYSPTGTPLTRLELNTEHGSSPFTITAATASPVASFPATGWSGLRFDDLTDASTPSANPGGGVLGLNANGDVIYVTTAPPGSTGIGYCGSPCGTGGGLTFMTGSGGYDLNANNLYFNGNGAGSGIDNVAIGNGCCYAPVAKLDVLQSSGSNNTIGINVENDDISSGTSFAPQPLIGIRSYIANAPFAAYSVAGWFQAAIIPGSTYWNYSVFVPQYGGQVCIGYPFYSNVLAAAYVVDINGAGRISGGIWAPSDTLIKKNVNYFKSGIKVIRQLNPVSFKFNGRGGFDTAGTHIGVIAENVARCAPYAVQHSTILKDTINRDTANILNVYEEAILYTAVNAIKQVDSVNTTQQSTIDSLRTMRTTVDSLRSALKSIQTCLNQLCGTSGGQGVTGPQNGGPNTNATKSQDITLSGAIGGTPLLYQNTPNPFGTGGTKINYYLPEGTMGASIIFYDTYGNMLKTVQLSQTGNSTLNITPDNLSNGIYSYSLIINGTVIDSKKMLLQK